MFFHRSGGGVSWLLVGLGNPGAKYASTRHNMGFLALDGLADREGFRFNKLRFRAWTAQWKVGDQQVLVMKPQTYMNLSGESVGEAARMVGISRSAFYKYKDAVQPFQDMKAGHIITFYALLKDNPGVLSNFLSIFANSGANILTINQTIPTNGCAGITISAETSEMVEDLEAMMARVSGAEGVLKFEVQAA